MSSSKIPAPDWRHRYIQISYGNTTTILQEGIIGGEGIYFIILVSQGTEEHPTSLYLVRLYNDNYYVDAIREGDSHHAPRIRSNDVIDTNNTGSNVTIRYAVIKLL